jgi:DnaK suppressor protein|tara:strand:- start:104348 stop:104536 length:189 start_codon:yes stop_codon:yes gene_type:complete
MAADKDHRRILIEQQLAAITTALGRLDNDEYGYCLKCGEELTPRRLDHNPAVTTCIDCPRGA